MSVALKNLSHPGEDSGGGSGSGGLEGLEFYGFMFSCFESGG